MMKGSTGSYNATRDKIAARRGPKALFMVRYCICIKRARVDTGDMADYWSNSMLLGLTI